jgi:hypothetical protein
MLTKISTNSGMLNVDDQKFESVRECKSTLTEDIYITAEIKQRVVMQNRSTWSAETNSRYLGTGAKFTLL